MHNLIANENLCFAMYVKSTMQGITFREKSNVLRKSNDFRNNVKIDNSDTKIVTLWRV